MSGREVAYRLRQALQARLERSGIGLAEAGAARRAPGRPWLSTFPTAVSSTPYTVAADRTLAGRFDILALRDIDLGVTPRWNTDPKTGIDAPIIFGKTLDYRNDKLVGDIKYLWELNRHLELVTLAQAWYLTRQEKYAHGCRQLLDSWFDQCPYPKGPNWTSSLEHGVRLVNWSFCWHLLGADSASVFSGSDGQAFKDRWLRSIYQHCHFIHGHLSRHSSANNHLLGELTGLFIGCSTWPLWSAIRRWGQSARAELEREALVQTSEDGVNREQATWYHHSVADMMLLAGLVARANDCDFSSEFWQRLESMLEFIASVMDVAGNVPNFGDSDDGVMVRFVPTEDFDVYRSLLSTGAVLFRRPEFALKAQGVDDKTRWLLGDDRVLALGSQDGRPTRLPVRRAFPQGGYYVLGGRFEQPDEVRIVADAGPLGYLGIAAHGHADALSFVLSVAGKPLLVDSGTYAYHTQKEWRDYFRGTSAHNTLRIDGQDQSLSGGNFLWLQHAPVVCELFRADVSEDRLVASHGGYGRLRDPVLHRRELRYVHAESTLYVFDELHCQGDHLVEIFWHFSEGCSVERSRDGVRAWAGSSAIDIVAPSELDCRVETAQQGRPLGWVSRRLDCKSPAAVAVISGQLRGSCALQTRILVRRTV